MPRLDIYLSLALVEVVIRTCAGVADDEFRSAYLFQIIYREIADNAYSVRKILRNRYAGFEDPNEVVFAREVFVQVFGYVFRAIAVGVEAVGPEQYFISFNWRNAI